MTPEAEWTLALRSSGHRVTSQRLAILSALSASRHPTAESLHDQLQAQEPTLSLSTVYRNLAVLQDVGLVTHAHVGAGGPVYHLASEPAHIHLSCLRCGSVTSVVAATARAFADRVAAETWFQIDPGHSAVYGVCGSCLGAREDSPR